MIDEEEFGPDLIIQQGDCEFPGICAACKQTLAVIKPNQAGDVLLMAWEHHVMSKACPGPPAAEERDLTSAVEAAARALFDQGQADRRDDGRKRPDGQAWQWEDLRRLDQHAFRATVLPLVTAAFTTLEVQ